MWIFQLCETLVSILKWPLFDAPDLNNHMIHAKRQMDFRLFGTKKQSGVTFCNKSLWKLLKLSSHSWALSGQSQKQNDGPQFRVVALQPFIFLIFFFTLPYEPVKWFVWQWKKLQYNFFVWLTFISQDILTF